uniref:PPM-type phosphatase domain-containing protein n=1 Tax=Timema douglasi TaxID=61478 RepID=A0A7R8VK54_TIMDO|nr:unnamed protein product [Timema douglasi]
MYLEEGGRIYSGGQCPPVLGSVTTSLSFHCRVGESTCLYGVFDGHEGVQAATFALERMAAEILLGQLTGKSTDEEIKEVLRQAFITVERGYLESVDDCLAQRTSLQYEIPDNLTPYEAYQKFPHLVDKLNSLNLELSSGTTAVVALVYGGRLYVANVGDSRALLCRSHLGNQENTRCLGNYLVKGGYKEFEELADASTEPVIAEPEIHGGIVLDDSCRFLLLMSDGLYKSLQEATGTDQFREQSTLTGVAQAVVDKIVRIHHDVYMSGSTTSNGQSIITGKRDDITLLVRNFNFPMPNALNSPTNAVVRFNPVVTTVNTPQWEASDDNLTSENSMTDTNTTATNTTDQNDTSTTESSSDIIPHRLNPMDPNQRVNSYVDFSEYYRNVEKMRQEGTLPPGIDF